MPGATGIYLEKSRRPQWAAFVLIVSIWTACVFLSGRAYAQTDANEIKIPAAIYSGLDHLFALADPAKSIAFDPQLVAGVLDFVETPKKDDALYYANRFRGLTSGYYEFDVAKSLAAVVAYAYNPDIPGIATMPSSARFSQWTGAGANSQELGRLMHGADKLDSPVVLKGIQSLEITPDPTSGAYYAYKSFQIFTMFKHRRRKVLVTVTRQADVSTVGKKGYILGEDSDWDYYYSGDTGLTLPMLGWVRSYIYDSAGINIYYEIDPGGPTVRCALFKWLRAGWSKINMVQKKDIHQGLKRFAMPLKEILEHPKLPSVARMADEFSRMMRLPDAALKSKMEIYGRLLEKRYNTGRNGSRKWPADFFENKDHWRQLSREEMESALVIEYMKYALGKSRPEEAGELLDLSR